MHEVLITVVRELTCSLCWGLSLGMLKASLHQVSGGEGSRPALVLTMNDVPRSWAGGGWLGGVGAFHPGNEGIKWSLIRGQWSWRDYRETFM